MHLYLYNADRAENQNLVSALSITINKILCQFFEFTQNLKRSPSDSFHIGAQLQFHCGCFHQSAVCPDWFFRFANPKLNTFLFVIFAIHQYHFLSLFGFVELSQKVAQNPQKFPQFLFSGDFDNHEKA